ncbi:MAG: DNA cytosine methyltransferase [Proteobacteria bacterium]|nr:DNA cytosine methyltransferase [Pseudomonadota bacterium]
MSAYYNEFDPKAAAWLRQLIKNGDIADGTVDERSIIEVEASDLDGFTQHHFFAGVGVWSYALRNAGWTDDRPVCTASLPCQPFSAAGNQKGKEDERHLLPHFLELVGQCNFHTIFGEQVETAIKHGWLDDLYTEMENQDYSVGSAIIGAHSVSKPHIRKRIYWVAHPISEGSERGVSRGENQGRQSFNGHTRCNSTDSRVVNSISDQHRCSERGVDGETNRAEISDRTEVTQSGELSGTSEYVRERSSATIGVGNSDSDGCKEGGETTQTTGHRDSFDSASGIDWLYCRDQKYRPIKSGIKPLVDGIARGMVYSSDTVIEANASAEARNVRLKGYGNAIVAPVAEEFIRATMEVINQAD